MNGTNTYFHIFVKKRCKFCSKATKFLDEKQLPYVVTCCDKAPGVLQGLKDACEWKTVPLVFEVLVTGTVSSFIGGYTELEEYLDGAQEEEGRGEGTDVTKNQMHFAEDDGVQQGLT